MFGCASDQQPPKEDLTQSEFKEIQQDWTSSDSDTDKGHKIVDDFPLHRPQPIRFTNDPNIIQRPAMTLNLADHSSGGQANPTHETKTTLPMQRTSKGNFTFALSNMKKSPQSDNLQALQSNETQFRPIEQARRNSTTRASISSPQASTDPTPHWQEQLQPTVQFRTHYLFGSTQSPVEFSFNQRDIQSGKSSDMTQQRMI
jgi:hypothetical protein